MVFVATQDISNAAACDLWSKKDGLKNKASLETFEHLSILGVILINSLAPLTTFATLYGAFA